MHTQLERIRSDAAECLLLSSLATDNKSNMFAKMAEHLNDLASELEKTLALGSSNLTHGELIPFRPRAGREEAGATDITASVPHEDSAEANAARRQTARSRRLWPWLLVVVVGISTGASLWVGLHPNRLHEQLAGYWTSFQQGQTKETGVDSQYVANTLAALMATEQREREAIFKRLSALDIQIEGVAGELDKLRHAQALAASPAVGPDDITNTVEKPSERNLDNTIRNTAAITARAACQRFRSYDVATGTYVTLDGRRLSCP